MSTKRNAVIFYGVSLRCDFDKAEELEKSKEIDVLVDGMCGEYFLVGKKLLDIEFDSYDPGDADEGVKPLEISMADKTKVKAALKRHFPNASVPQFLYVTHYH
jgi:hypothetical protein